MTDNEVELDDLVIDTNIFVHASRPQEWQADSVMFCSNLLLSKLAILVDEGFALDESSNKSLLGSEYLTHLKPGEYGYQVLLKMLLEQRVVVCNLKVAPNVHAKVKRFITGAKPRDRTVLKLATKARTKHLVTHDFEDFQADKRVNIRRELGVYVVTAAEYDWSRG